MLLEEFTKLTGFYPTDDLYATIEEAYYEFNGDKVDFCRAYQKNEGGMAESIQVKCNMHQRASKDMEIKRLSGLEDTLKNLQKKLDQELEWKPYEDEHNVSQSDYAKLAAGASNGNNTARFMSDEEAKSWLYSEYGFAKDKVTIIHEIDAEEVNRHRQVRKTGRKLDRRPVYCATDYHYIRFDTTYWRYEVWNGTLRPFFS